MASMEEDKFAILTRIFGNDLTDSVIRNTLQENNNDFDATVEKLLTIPSNKPQPPPQQQNAGLDAPARENIQRLHNMFSDLTQSVITTVYETNKRDVDGTVDTLLNLTSNEVASGAKRDAEIARQEAELRAYEEYKKLQQRLQEEERKSTEAAQRAAMLKAKEDEEARRKKEEADAQRRKEIEAAQRAEQEKALAEQERMLREFQLRKAEEERRKQEAAAKDEAKRGNDEEKNRVEAEKKRVEAEKKRIEEEKRLVEEEKKRALEAKKIIEEERKRTQEEKAKLETEAKKLTEQKKQEERKKQEVEEAQKKRQEEEERIMKKRFEEEKAMLQEQRNRAESERKILEERVRQEKAREEEERKKRLEEEKRFREEQERIRRSWEEKVKQLEKEREKEEAKRTELKRQEDEERMRQEADMRKVLELERLKLDEQRRRVEEEKRVAEERLRAMELAALKREEEEERRRMEEEERARVLREQDEERLRREEEEVKRAIEEAKRKAAEDIVASAVLVKPADTPKVEINATAEGNEITGKWALKEGTLPSTQAWVGLYPRRSNNSYVGFSYVSGTEGEFQFKGLTPGHYEVRFFTNKPISSRIAESMPLLVGPKVVSFTAQQQGDQLMLEYRFESSNPTAWDWVGIFEKDQRRNKPYITSVYGNVSGAITVPLPRTPGTYQARLFAAGSKYNEQACVDFVVVDNDCVHAEETAAPGAPIKATWVLRTVEPSSSDWIGLFTIGEPSNSKYLASAYTNGASVGEVTIPVPKDISTGVYELRLFSSKVGKYTTFKTSGPIFLPLQPQ